jgi:hypothetical protein
MASIFDIARFGEFAAVAATGWVVEQLTVNAEPQDKALIKGVTQGATWGAGIGSFVPVVGTGAGALIGAFYGLITSANQPQAMEGEKARASAEV